MSERGAEGILRREREARERAKAAQPVDHGTAGHAQKKASRVKGAAAGAAGGAPAGPEGAAVGAVLGALTGGGGGKGKRRGPGNRALVAEFVICMAMLAMSPLVDSGGSVTTGKWMKKGSATAAVFIILGFVSSMGESAKKVAAGLGLLMTLSVLLNERSVFGVLVKAVGGSEDVPSEERSVLADVKDGGG